MGVLLIVASELGRELAEGVLEAPGDHEPHPALPELGDEIRVGLGEGTPRTDGVVAVEVTTPRLAVIFEKEVGEELALGEALEGGVHEACVAQVLEAGGTGFGVGRGVGGVGGGRSVGDEGSRFGGAAAEDGVGGAGGGAKGVEGGLIGAQCGRGEVAAGGGGE